MFYCELCRKRAQWPTSLTRSRGPCEVCNEVAVCWDIPSRYLPEPRTTKRRPRNGGEYPMLTIVCIRHVRPLRGTPSLIQLWGVGEGSWRVELDTMFCPEPGRDDLTDCREAWRVYQGPLPGLTPPIPGHDRG